MSGRSGYLFTMRRRGQRASLSTAWTKKKEADDVVTLHRQALLSVYNCLYTLQPTILGLIRSKLHCCLQCQGYPACRRLKAINPRRNLKIIPSATFISISQKFKRRRQAVSVCRIDARQNTSAPSGMSVPPEGRGGCFTYPA